VRHTRHDVKKDEERAQHLSQCKSVHVAPVPALPCRATLPAHFIVYDIPKDATSLAAGALTGDPKGAFVPGMNYRMEAYSGPCPLASAPRHYAINLWATDLAAGTLNAGMTCDLVLAALTGHVVGTATLIGTYTREQ
jgi:phosphatidylethanolamine-binding protein (PEBP) family uncharacterized protein